MWTLNNTIASAYQEICPRLAEDYFCLPGLGLLPIIIYPDSPKCPICGNNYETLAQVFIDCHVVFKTFFKNFSKRLNEKMI